MVVDLETAGLALGTAAAVGTAHGLAHMEFGEAGSLEDAAVTEVGAVVAATTAVGTGAALALDDEL